MLKRVFFSITNHFERLVLFLFTVFVFICLICGGLYHGDVDQTTYSEAIDYTFNNPLILRWLILWLVAFFLILNLKIWDNRKHCIVLVFCCAFFVTVISLFFCIWNGYTPVSDQEQMWEGGIQLVYGDSAAFNAKYFDQYHNQCGASILASFLIRLTGSRSYMSWRALNCLCAGTNIFGISYLTWILSKDNRMTMVSTILTTCFIPYILYSALVYGTLISLSFTIWSFVAAIRYLESGHKVDLIFSVILCALANATYSGTTIATVALTLTYLMRAGAEIRAGGKWIKFLLSSIVTILICVICLSATEKYFYSHTGISDQQGIPATAYIYMGITSDDEHSVCGPGTYNSENVNIYIENNRNSAQTREAANKEIKKALLEYLNGKRNLSFFAEKVRNQWADPWFSSLIMVINYYDIDRPLMDSFRDFLASGLIGKIQTLLTSHVIVIYTFSALYALKIICGKQKEAKKDGCSENYLIYIYFVGGFIFYLFWESKARYCLPYFTMLLPLASIEIVKCNYCLRELLKGCVKLKNKAIHVENQRGKI